MFKIYPVENRPRIPECLYNIGHPDSSGILIPHIDNLHRHLLDFKPSAVNRY